MPVPLPKTICIFFLLADALFTFAQPANDNCAGAITLTSQMACSNTAGTLAAATNSGIAGGSCGSADDDVWYRFVAQQTNATIRLSNLSTATPSVGRNDPSIDLFNSNSGACIGSFITCATSAPSVTSLSLTASSLIPGNTYYVRVYTAQAGAPSANNGFDICVTHTLPPTVIAGRANEVFLQTILSAPNVLADPWEITYGPDGVLWVTEAKGYKVYRIDPVTGNRTMVLDISQGSAFLPAAQQTFNVQFASNFSPWPQGGFAGLAIHPDFIHPTTPKKFVYVSYVHRYDSTSVLTNGGVFFTNRVVRFTYDEGANRLGNPVSLCDTLSGSNDHNSQRMIIAPLGGVYYLFYASGDMGAGQFGNAARAIKSQNINSYEGKILRFNLEADGDTTVGFQPLDRWIPNGNPFNGARQSAVWATGMRNNQGFAFANIDGFDRLYGSSHGPYSDDEINILEVGKNYGHPRVIGYAADDNYNNSRAGSPSGSLPLIVDESNNALSLGASYKDPLFSAYAPSAAVVNNIYNGGVPNNGDWPSEGWSGLDVYTNTMIPGWKNSLIMCSLKWGRVLRLKLGPQGDTILKTGTQDTVSYFGSQNRFRDVAFGPNGREVYVVMDRSTTTSGPSSANPVVPACQGCLQKYTFLGYQHNGGANRSTIPNFIPVENGGTPNSCVTASSITINAANNNHGSNLWVPITGADGNIIGEIKANGNNLGLVTASLYLKTGALREDPARRLYINRHITITPEFQPSSPVSVRLYFTKDEYNRIDTGKNSIGVSSGVSAVTDIRVLKNNDVCGTPFTTASTWITPAVAEAFGSDGYVVQFDVSSFSTFYFGSNSMLLLDQDVLTLKASLQNRTGVVQWTVDNGNAITGYEIERSYDGTNFRKLGAQVPRTGSGLMAYQFNDEQVLQEPSGLAYYRLKLLLQNGNYRYSKTVSITLPQVYYTFAVLPNPVKEVLNLQVKANKTGVLRLDVTDAQGRLVYQGARQAEAGTNFMKVDTGKWAAQSYVLRVYDAEGQLLFAENIIKL
jgi:trimeric autotransporter adhesin